MIIREWPIKVFTVQAVAILTMSLLCQNYVVLATQQRLQLFTASTVNTLIKHSLQENTLIEHLLMMKD